MSLWWLPARQRPERRSGLRARAARQSAVTAEQLAGWLARRGRAPLQWSSLLGGAERRRGGAAARRAPAAELALGRGRAPARDELTLGRGRAGEGLPPGMESRRGGSCAAGTCAVEAMRAVQRGEGANQRTGAGLLAQPEWVW